MNNNSYTHVRNLIKKSCPKLEVGKQRQTSTNSNLCFPSFSHVVSRVNEEEGSHINTGMGKHENYGNAMSDFKLTNSLN